MMLRFNRWFAMVFSLALGMGAALTPVGASADASAVLQSSEDLELIEAAAIESPHDFGEALTYTGVATSYAAGAVAMTALKPVGNPALRPALNVTAGGMIATLAGLVLMFWSDDSKAADLDYYLTPEGFQVFMTLTPEQRRRVIQVHPEMGKFVSRIADELRTIQERR